MSVKLEKNLRDPDPPFPPRVGEARSGKRKVSTSWKQRFPFSLIAINLQEWNILLTNFKQYKTITGMVFGHPRSCNDRDCAAHELSCRSS